MNLSSDKFMVLLSFECACALLHVLVLAVLTLGFLCFSLCTVSHLPSLCLSHSLFLSFKNALYYRACPAGKRCSFGEQRQGDGPVLKQQTVYWYLLEDIVRSTLTVVLQCILMVFLLLSCDTISFYGLFINEIKIYKMNLVQQFI